MAISIPTGELIGLLNDVNPFACPHDDLPDLNVVRLNWDGEALHAAAYDTLRMVRSTWHPDDDNDKPANDKTQLVPVYGGDDNPWGIYMRLEDAKALVTHFKLPAKASAVIITLDHDRGTLVVARSAAAGYEQVDVTVTGRMVEFPNVDEILDRVPGRIPVTDLDFIGHHLTDFGTVRQRGLLHLTFDGPERAVRIAIGRRFVGTVRPDRSAKPRQATLAGIGGVDF